MLKNITGVPIQKAPDHGWIIAIGAIELTTRNMGARKLTAPEQNPIGFVSKYQRASTTT